MEYDLLNVRLAYTFFAVKFLPRLRIVSQYRIRLVERRTDEMQMDQDDSVTDPFFPLTIVKHIQGVKEDIQRNRQRLITLEHKCRTSAMAAALGFGLSVSMLLLAPGIIFPLVWFVLASVATLVFLSARKERATTKAILRQSMFYRDLIVEETYSGKDLGPKL